MIRYFIVNPTVKSTAMQAVEAIDCDSNMMIEIKKRTRTLDQNAKMWPMLQDLVNQVPIYHGIEMTTHKYKDLFTGSLSGCEFVPAVGGFGMVGIGGSSSKLTTAQMADLITMIEMFGAERGVKFTEGRWE